MQESESSVNLRILKMALAAAVAFVFATAAVGLIVGLSGGADHASLSANWWNGIKDVVVPVGCVVVLIAACLTALSDDDGG